ncbi:hypothetical protein F5Y10DRAFT_264206 [Nemania abortiva]|nr:hypothetical protein F5Y10DRAFT_264206 [Nemania abortiva]
MRFGRISLQIRDSILRLLSALNLPARSKTLWVEPPELDTDQNALTEEVFDTASPKPARNESRRDRSAFKKVRFETVKFERDLRFAACEEDAASAGEQDHEDDNENDEGWGLPQDTDDASNENHGQADDNQKMWDPDYWPETTQRIYDILKPSTDTTDAENLDQSQLTQQETSPDPRPSPPPHLRHLFHPEEYRWDHTETEQSWVQVSDTDLLKFAARVHIDQLDFSDADFRDPGVFKRTADWPAVEKHLPSWLVGQTVYLKWADSLRAYQGWQEEMARSSRTEGLDIHLLDDFHETTTEEDLKL